MEILFIFIIGICVGSFLSVLVDRFARDESVLTGRSYCESCKHPLVWKDLIPLISYLVIRGRCRYCRVSLSSYYPIIEFTTGVFFAVTLLVWVSRFGSLYFISSVYAWVYLLFLLVIASFLIVVLFADIKYGIIPDKITYPAIGIVLLYGLLFQGDFPSHLLAGASAFLFFFLLFVITKGKGMGFGDVKFALFMGLLLGFPGIVFSFYIAFLTGACISLILIILRKKKLRGATIPFGPFLVIGTYITLISGNALEQFIRSLLFT